MVRPALLGVAAALLALMLFVRLADSGAATLVQRWYEPVLVATALVFALLAIVLGVGTLRSPGRWEPRPRTRDLLLGGALLAPVVLAIAYQPPPLGSASLSANVDSARSASFGATAAQAAPLQRNVYQWAYEFAHASPAEVVGQPVDVVGFVHRPAGTGPERFEVARFVVSCCVADARGYAVPVQWAGAAALTSDTWVRVRGHVAIGADGGMVVLARTVEQVDVPANPYVYP
jgi:uncharacterized repeat protein (TIGR03943 family)